MEAERVEGEVTGPGQLRVFSVACGLLLAGLGWRALCLEWTGAGSVAALAAATVTMVGLRWPRLMGPLHDTLKTLAAPMGKGVGRVLVCLVFLGVVTPLALLLRVTGRSPLGRVRPRDGNLGWQPRPPPRPPEDYLKPY